MMFAVEEYNAYVEAQERADRLFHLEQEDPETWAAEALAAQDKADLLYDIYEHAAGLQALDDY